MNQQMQALVQSAFDVEIYNPAAVDVQQTPLYDKVTIAASGAVSEDTMQWFTSPTGKNYSATNVTNPKRLASPETFSVQSIRLYIAPTILLLDATNLQNGFAFQLFLGQKYYSRAPIWFYNQGGGIAGMPATTATSTTITAWTNGLPTREAILPLNIPLTIGNQMEFWANLTGTAITATAAASGGTGIIMMCMLDGYYARGIQ
jgi:hypothetical protein